MSGIGVLFPFLKKENDSFIINMPKCVLLLVRILTECLKRKKKMLEGGRK